MTTTLKFNDLQTLKAEEVSLTGKVAAATDRTCVLVFLMCFFAAVCCESSQTFSPFENFNTKH